MEQLGYKDETITSVLEEIIEIRRLIMEEKNAPHHEEIEKNKNDFEMNKIELLKRKKETKEEKRKRKEEEERIAREERERKEAEERRKREEEKITKKKRRRNEKKIEWNN